MRSIFQRRNPERSFHVDAYLPCDLALFSATTLPLVVVITKLGKATGRMLPENAAALVGAGILSVLIFPLIALSMREQRPSRTARPAPTIGD